MMRKLLFVLILLIVAALAFVTFRSYSDGTRVGTLTKLSRKGYIFKTHEGQLMTGGMTDGTGTFSSQVWEFSVDDANQTAIDALNLSQKMGQRVAVHYEEKIFQLPWNGDTKYFVTSVELIPAANVMPVQPAVVAPPPPPAPVVVDSTTK
jgi:hypothetical protein